LNLLKVALKCNFFYLISFQGSRTKRPTRGIPGKPGYFVMTFHNLRSETFLKSLCHFKTTLGSRSESVLVSLPRPPLHDSHNEQVLSIQYRHRDPLMHGYRGPSLFVMFFHSLYSTSRVTTRGQTTSKYAWYHRQPRNENLTKVRSNFRDGTTERIVLPKGFTTTHSRKYRFAFYDDQFQVNPSLK
jgi:hypothetical protein